LKISGFVMVAVACGTFVLWAIHTSMAGQLGERLQLSSVKPIYPGEILAPFAVAVAVGIVWLLRRVVKKMNDPKEPISTNRLSPFLPENDREALDQDFQLF